MDRHKDHYSSAIYKAEAKAGPFGGLNPTKRLIPLSADSCSPSKTPNEPHGARSHSSGSTNGKPAGQTAQDGETQQAPTASGDPRAYHMWSSRDNRKGRHAIVVPESAAGKGDAGGDIIGKLPRPTNSAQATLYGILKMFIRYPIWDVSYLVATIFTLGSIVWVFNGFFVWLPLQALSSEFPGEVDFGGSITAFIGATIFEVGSILLMIEAVNENRSECFGWALQEVVDYESGGRLELHRHEHCKHHHANRRSWLKGASMQEKPSSALRGETLGKVNEKDGTAVIADKGRTWQWVPSAHELQTHYIWDIGFLACSFQMAGASVFWVAGLTGLPPILNVLSVPQENVVFWTPQVVGGTGFIISGLLFMIETQRKWYLPALDVLGWHIGFWNLIGAIGFTLCGALGYGSANPVIEYASSLATFIGSWAFLIGSVVQWYESLDKYPITWLADNKLVYARNMAAKETAKLDKGNES